MQTRNQFESQHLYAFNLIGHTIKSIMFTAVTVTLAITCLTRSTAKCTPTDETGGLTTTSPMTPDDLMDGTEDDTEGSIEYDTSPFSVTSVESVPGNATTSNMAVEYEYEYGYVTNADLTDDVNSLRPIILVPLAQNLRPEAAEGSEYDTDSTEPEVSIGAAELASSTNSVAPPTTPNPDVNYWRISREIDQSRDPRVEVMSRELNWDDNRKPRKSRYPTARPIEVDLWRERSFTHIKGHQDAQFTNYEDLNSNLFEEGAKPELEADPDATMLWGQWAERK